MSWSKSNFAHWGTYRALVVDREIDPTLVSFEGAEKYKMPGLSFYVLGTRKEDLQNRAELVSMELFNFIVVNYSPEWQDKNKTKSPRGALDALIPILIDKDKMISDLANVIDNIFKFSNENK